MARHRPLQVFAIDDLVILLWRRMEKLASEIDIVFNDVRLDRPLIGVEFAERPHYLLAIRASGLVGRGPSSIAIISKDKQILAKAGFETLRTLPASLVATWSVNTRSRVEKALIRQASSSFPSLSVSVRKQIGEVLAEPGVVVSFGPEERVYIRMPWAFSQASSVLDVFLRPLLQGDDDESVEPVKALLDGPWLHFFTCQSAALQDPERLWLLDAGKIRCVPFKIPGSDRDAGTLAAWVEKILAGYSGSRGVLRAYAGMMLPLSGKGSDGPPVARRLVGKVEGMRGGAVVGWVLDANAPQKPVRLKIAVGEQVLQVVEANLPRPDIQPRDYGNCGFAWRLDESWLSGQPHDIRVVCADTGEEPEGSPVRVGRGQYDGDFGLDEAGCLIGWICERSLEPEPAEVRVLIDGESVAEIPVRFVDRESTEKAIEGRGESRLEFRVPLPDRVFDTASHALEIEIVGAGGFCYRLPQAVRVKADYQGHIDVAGPSRLVGWVFNTLAPRRPVTLDLLINGKQVSRFKTDRIRTDLEGDNASRRCGFDIAVPPGDSGNSSIVLEICLADTSIRVLTAPILHIPYQIAISSLNSLAEALNDEAYWQSLSGGGGNDVSVANWLRSHIVARVLGELRRAKSFPAQISLPVAGELRLPQRQPREAKLDVIIPVYGAREDALNCIASVLASECSVVMDLIVVNDASPDPGLNAELRRLAAEDRFVLLENSANVGFVGSVNRGMRLHPGRDVVLLNSDTVLPKGWLDRLHAAANGAKNIGTVTPFSNNATICSFPRFCQENALPDGFSVEQLDRLFAEVNAGQTVDIPTAVGFCMYIKRDVLDEVGYFDEGRWGKGYGEENDFCLRASALGWRHVVACDVFVEHKGAVSFAEHKRDFVRRNLAKLDALYPDYSGTIQRFIARDPLIQSRNGVIKELLKAHSDSYLLFVMHNLGGGTQVAADDLAMRLGQEGVAVLELRCAPSERWRLTCHGLPYTLQYRYPEDFDALVQDLRDLGVWHLHCHHTMNFPRRSLDLPKLLGIRYDFTVHDYLPICPRINLIDESGVYCGEAQYVAKTCNGCIRVNGPHPEVAGQFAEFGGDVATWREGYAEFLRGARRVFAPSQDAARRLRRHFQLLNLHVEPHPEALRKVPEMIREGKADTVAVLGAIGPHKGFDILLSCARNAAKERLPLQFVVIGFTSDDDALRKFGNVTITGEYRDADLPKLIAQSNARVALFLSPWPETYSFTLSEAWMNRLFPVAFDIGAIAERIKSAKWGRLMPLATAPRAINQFVLGALSEVYRVPEGFTTGRDLHSVLQEYYGLEKPSEKAVRGAGAGVRALLGSGQAT